MKRRFVLFDMDGVILDSEAGSFEFTRQILAKRGICVELDYLLKKIGKTSRQVAEEVVREYQLTETAEEFLARNRSYGNYYADSPRLEAMAGLYDFLEFLRGRDIRMGVVSSTGASGVLTALNRLRVLPWMDVVVCGNMVKRPKPDPEGYLLSARWLGAQPGECVVLEDSPIGISAAKNAGMRVIGFRGSVLKQDTSRADLECGSFQECMEKAEQIFESLF